MLTSCPLESYGPHSSYRSPVSPGHVRGILVLRNVLLFWTAVLLALTAGRAFWVSLGENPFNMSGATYVEFFQQLDRAIAIPIAVTGIGGTLLAGLAAMAHKAERKTFRLLLAACGFGLVGSLVTILVNVPINERVATWKLHTRGLICDRFF
jgi:hypothetical protein